MKWFFIILFFSIIVPSATYAQVVISEIFYDSAETPEHNYEFVEIYNSGGSIDIGGWILQDDSKEYTIPSSTILDSGAYFIINRALVSNSFSLKNTGETLILKNESGTQDTKVYEDDAQEGQSLQKQQDGSWSTGTPTPGSGALSTSEQDTSTSESQTQTQTNIITTEVTRYNTVTIEPPQDIYLRLAMPELTNTGVQTRFSAEVYDATGKSVSTANVEWSFGDGATARGTQVRHKYKYPGTYAVSAYVKSGTLTDEVSTQIQVVEADASVRLNDDYEFVEAFNNSEHKLDVSGWMLRSGYKSFYIPDRTIILPNSSVRFSTDTTKLSTLRREKHVLLLDSARNMVADSREYVEPKQEDEPEGTATTTDSSNTETKQQVAVPIVQRFVPPPPVPQPTVVPQEPVQQEVPIANVTNPQVATAVVSTESPSIFDSGIEWLLGLLSVIGFGLVALRSFNSGSKQTDDTDISDFDISEIK